MKKLLSLQLLFVFLLFTQAQSQYTVPVQYDSTWLSVVSGNARFSLYTGTTPCQPNLPYYKLTFLLPPDANLDSVSYTFFNLATRVLAGDYVVPPVPPIYIMVGDQVVPQWPPGLTIVDGKDMGIYGTNAYFPASHIGEELVGMGRQYKLADLIIYPYLYNPVTLKLKVLVSGQVRVNFATIPGFVVTIPRSSWYEAQIRGTIDNDTSIFQLYEPSSRVQSVASTIRRKSGQKSMVIVGNQFRVPEIYSGYTNSVTLFDFLGKKIYSVTTKEPVISIKQGKGLLPAKYVAKIAPE